MNETADTVGQDLKDAGDAAAESVADATNDSRRVELLDVSHHPRARHNKLRGQL